MLKRPAIRASLHQLRIFAAVAQHASVTRAAAALALAQPTVSIQLKELAAAVGMPLIEISGRRFSLTHAGEDLLAVADRMYEEWGAFEMRVAEMKGLRRGRLRLAAVTTAEYFVPDLLGPFARAYPGIEVQLEVANRDQIVDRLEQNRDDLYVMMMPPGHVALERIAFLDNPLVLLAPLGHPLAKRRALPLAALAGESFIVRERGSGTRMAAEEAFRAHGFVPRVRMELGSNEAVKHAVAAGLGLAVLSQHAVGATPAASGLAVLAVRGFPVRRSWQVVYPSGRPLSIVARTLLEFVRAQPASVAGRRSRARSRKASAGRG